MKTSVIIQDHAGYFRRVSTLKAIHPDVHAVTPYTHPRRHAVSVRPPREWLPQDLSNLNRAHWWKSDAMAFAAAKALNLDSDYYWFIESDVVATQERWRALFSDWKGDDADLVAPSLRSRLDGPHRKVWKTCRGPEWVGVFSFVFIFRLSRRALAECIASAEEMRECLSEVSVASVVHRAGFRLAGLNERQTHGNNQCLTPCEKCHIPYPALLNHPVKSNVVWT